MSLDGRPDVHLLGEGIGVGRPVHRGVVHVVGDLVAIRVRVRVRVRPVLASL